MAAASRAIPAETPTAPPIAAPIPGMPKYAPRPPPTITPMTMPAGRLAAPQPGKLLALPDWSANAPCSSVLIAGHAFPEKVENFSLLWETPLQVLRDNSHSIADNIKDAFATLNKLDINVVLCRQLSLQTGGVGQVISTYAVGDTDSHAVHLSLG